MIKAFKQLDEILRGDATQLSSLEKGQIELPLGGLLFVMILLGIIYGLCAGSFNLLHPLDEDAVITTYDAWMQLFASAVKMPALFFLTLLITFPSLYVFNALVGSQLRILSVLKLLIASIAVMLAVVASLGPIVIFFSLCTSSYSFMVLLNVTASTIAGILGLSFLLRTLNRLIMVQEHKFLSERINAAVPKEETQAQVDCNVPDLKDNKMHGALGKVGPTHRKAKSIVQIWILVFSLVGAQMSWVLRPFIGSPNMAFEWFRDRESNFFLAIIQTWANLFSSN